jgi:Tfp pilus assembly protein PilV
MPPIKSRRHSFQAGYSLIEVIVAGVVIAAVVVGIFEIISNGSSLNRKEMLRRRVYQELERILEKPEYSSRSPYYLALATTGGAYVNLSPVTLDNKGSSPLTVTPQVRVDAWTFTYSGVNVPAKRITVQILITYPGETVQRTESLRTFVTLTDVN